MGEGEDGRVVGRRGVECATCDGGRGAVVVAGGDGGVGLREFRVGSAEV